MKKPILLTLGAILFTAALVTAYTIRAPKFVITDCVAAPAKRMVSKPRPQVLLANAETGARAGSNATPTVTATAGTISECGSESIFITTAPSLDPLHYSYSEATTYEDANGHPVSVESVRCGLQATVYYTNVGRTLRASKVIVWTNRFESRPILAQAITTAGK